MTYFLHFLVARGKLQKFLSTYLTHMHTYMYFTHPIDFFTLPILKKNTNLSGMVSLWCDSYSRHFGTINKYQNGEQNLSWNIYYSYDIVFTLMPNL